MLRPLLIRHPEQKLSGDEQVKVKSVFNLLLK